MTEHYRTTRNRTKRAAAVGQLIAVVYFFLKFCKFLLTSASVRVIFFVRTKSKKVMHLETDRKATGRKAYRESGSQTHAGRSQDA